MSSSMSRETTREAAKWLQRQLLRLDWQDRHRLLAQIEDSKPRIHKEVLQITSPGDLLQGQATSVKLNGESPVIVLKNKPKCSKYRQVTLHRYTRH